MKQAFTKELYIWYSQLLRKAIWNNCTYNGQAIGFAIFGIDNGSSSHTDNSKNNVLVLGEGPTDGINDSWCWCRRR